MTDMNSNTVDFQSLKISELAAKTELAVCVIADVVDVLSNRMLPEFVSSMEHDPVATAKFLRSFADLIEQEGSKT